MNKHLDLAPESCVAFIAGAVVVLLITVVLGWLSGREIYSLMWDFGMLCWLVLIAVCGVCSVVTSAFLTVRDVSKRASRTTMGWHILCLALSTAVPVCAVGTARWTHRVSRTALFKSVGIQSLRSDAGVLIRNYKAPARPLGRHPRAQRVKHDQLPESFQKLGLKDVYVYPSSVHAMTGGFGSVRSGYTFLPAESRSSVPNAEKVVEGIYFSVTRD